MQLGELQHQMARFERRSATVVALSVDAPDDSLAMIERLGMTYPVASDPNQRVVQLFGVQNPQTRELALHAVYIVATDGTIFYRKVGRRRPVSAELIDAIDAHRGQYPQADVVEGARRTAVAYPTNNFQALLEVSQATPPAASVHAEALSDVLALVRSGRGDDAVFAYRKLIRMSPAADREALYNTAAWMARELFFAPSADALAVGTELGQRLARVRELETQLAAAGDERDSVEAQLAAARAGLSGVRARINQNADDWRLRSVKTTIRAYRELSRAGTLNDS